MKKFNKTTGNNNIIFLKLIKNDYFEKNRINGELLHKDKVVANIVNDELEVLNEEMLPIYFKQNGDLRSWLENRCIDTDRENSRLLKNILEIEQTNQISTVLYAHAHTLTDNYWIRLSTEPNLKYDDIDFKNDILFDIAIFGELPSHDITLNSEYFCTPELTLGGSFEKGWTLKNNDWFLIKTGENLNNFAEIIASDLCKYFNFNAVEYFKFNSSSVCCKNFTNNLEFDFEPMFDFVGDDDDLELSLNYIENINKSFIPDFLDMIFLDALLLNPDRHTNNYGLLKNSNTGEYIGLAPIFDNNLALFATKCNNINLDTGNSSQIKNFYLPILEKYSYKIPNLIYTDLKEIVKAAYYQFNPEGFSIKFTTDFIWNKYNFIKDNLK
ncbi:hypothetical protein [Clostridium perfringens]|uniref:HipA-like C-terminal domain-containing protein n=2 Tax=Clostridium perfringens TaxID=1502 RepID=A0A8H9UXT9_CLOPF|nr:hypothetical protein [Clostridium perfringens]MDU7977644.1 hypothetical protein [Clostridioides difficile]MBI6024482.1 hypothetical protein [Clostridium perfringens]MBI6048531.1 hypothetical protein [Clostridium perfringens]MCX0408262.1 hypothetical protein [Clostridium perfringens]MDK0553724.1 hypothetical protein [Clostridium perfringens]